MSCAAQPVETVNMRSVPREEFSHVVESNKAIFKIPMFENCCEP